MTTAEILSRFWKTDEIAACDVGMELVGSFIESCAKAVELDSYPYTLTLRADFRFGFSEYAAHCEKCNEV